MTLPTGGKATFGHRFAADDALIRITPVEIISWGLEVGQARCTSREIDEKDRAKKG